VSENPLLRIGPFSRASSLSVKMLRAYHEAGLLVPTEVDRETGYRSYSVRQLTDATIIRRLRELDVPLEAIRQVLDARDPAVTKKVLTEHSAILEDRLAVLRRTVDELYDALESPALHTPAERRHEPARTVVSVSATVTEEQWQPFLARTYELLHEAAAGAGCVVDGAFGACYPTLLDDDAQDVVAYLPVTQASLLLASARSAGARFVELPETEVAVLVHRGSYDDLADTYRELGAWVALHADPADLPVREIYVVGPHDSDDVDALRTEICWPIETTTREQ
jgi:DNA-binding transcriptional MerR regulator